MGENTPFLLQANPYSLLDLEILVILTEAEEGERKPHVGTLIVRKNDSVYDGS